MVLHIGHDIHENALPGLGLLVMSVQLELALNSKSPGTPMFVSMVDVNSLWKSKLLKISERSLLNSELCGDLNSMPKGTEYPPCLRCSMPSPVVSIARLFLQDLPTFKGSRSKTSQHKPKIIKSCDFFSFYSNPRFPASLGRYLFPPV
jgi:hypothetical protein